MSKGAETHFVKFLSKQTFLFPGQLRNKEIDNLKKTTQTMEKFQMYTST